MVSLSVLGFRHRLEYKSNPNILFFGIIFILFGVALTLL